MKILWNPWRYQYIKQFSERRGHGEECLFCKLRSMADREGYVVHRGNRAFVVLNAYPYNSGHVMIAPYVHVADPSELDDDTLVEITQLVKKVIVVLRKALMPDGFNIGANIGRVAGAGVPGHFHIHIVPRWVGDSNFMAIIAETKPLSVSLQEVYEVITKTWSEVI